MAAAKKAPAAKKATAKKTTGTSMTVFEEKMREKAKLAAAIEENVGGGGSFISLKGGRLNFQGAEIPGNAMNVVVVDHIIEYAWYGDRYDPENPQPPLAYAFGRDEPSMRWHENSIEEYAGELCKDSDINQWGSADTGAGKAAKNLRRLALLTEDQIEDPDGIAGEQVTYLKVPVTSVKGWAGYVRQLSNTLERPPLGVITEISVVPDPKTQFKLQFKLVETIDDPERLEALFAKQEVVEKEIDFPYQPADEEAPAKPARGRSQGRNAKPQRGGGGRGRGAAAESAPEKPSRGKAAPAAKAGKRKY